MDNNDTTQPEIVNREKTTSSANIIDDAPATTLLKRKNLAIVLMCVARNIGMVLLLMVYITSSFIAAFFPIALDQTIISTALPTIASQFQAVSDLSWIAGAYFLSLVS
jgi:MFS family permease